MVLHRLPVRSQFGHFHAGIDIKPCKVPDLERVGNRPVPIVVYDIEIIIFLFVRSAI